MKSILDPTFRYTSAVQTDVRKTFARVRKEQREAAAAAQAAKAEQVLKVRTLPVMTLPYSAIKPGLFQKGSK